MADVAETAKGALSTTFNVAKKFAIPVIAGIAIFSGVALIDGGSSTMAALSQSGEAVTLSNAFNVPAEGLKEAAVHLSDAASWSAEQLAQISAPTTS